MVRLNIVQGTLGSDLEEFNAENTIPVEFENLSDALDAAETILGNARPMRAIRRNWITETEYDTLSTIHVEIEQTVPERLLQQIRDAQSESETE